MPLYYVIVNTISTHLSVQCFDESHVPRFGLDTEILFGALIKGHAVGHRLPFGVRAVQRVNVSPCARTTPDLSQTMRIYIILNALFTTIKCNYNK